MFHLILTNSTIKIIAKNTKCLLCARNSSKSFISINFFLKTTLVIMVALILSMRKPKHRVKVTFSMSQRLKGELVLALEWIPLVTFLESCVGKQGQGVHCSYEVLFYFFPLKVLLYLPGTLYPGTFFQSHVLHYITWHWPCLSH